MQEVSDKDLAFGALAINAPARCPFLSLPFFWACKRKEVHKLKKFLMNRGSEDWFCESTLEKEGNKLLRREEK